MAKESTRHSIAAELRDHADHRECPPGHLFYRAAAELDALYEQLEAVQRENERLRFSAEHRFLRLGEADDKAARLQEQLEATQPCPYCGMTAQVELSRNEPGQWMCHGCADTFPAKRES